MHEKPIQTNWYTLTLLLFLAAAIAWLYWEAELRPRPCAAIATKGNAAILAYIENRLSQDAAFAERIFALTPATYGPRAARAVSIQNAGGSRADWAFGVHLELAGVARKYVTADFDPQCSTQVSYPSESDLDRPPLDGTTTKVDRPWIAPARQQPA